MNTLACSQNLTGRQDCMTGQQTRHRLRHIVSFQVSAKNRQFHLQNVESQGEIATDGDFRSRAARMPLTPTRPH